MKRTLKIGDIVFGIYSRCPYLVIGDDLSFILNSTKRPLIKVGTIQVVNGIVWRDYTTEVPENLKDIF